MKSKRVDLVAPNDPVLNLTAKKIPENKINSPEVQGIIEKLLTLAYGEQKDRTKPVLVGLAAPQAGISQRIILVDIGADGHGGVSDLRVFLNPEITWKSSDENEWYEGCYSTDSVCGIVSRPINIKMKSYDRNGNKVESDYTGYTARIFQHEIDHLDGSEFVSRITDPDKLHWVEENEFPRYRDKEAWRNWPKKCSRERWQRIKGIIPDSSA